MKKKVKLKKIILICDTFNPDKTSGAKLIDDLLNELVKKNHVLAIIPKNSNFLGLFNKNKILSKKKLKIVFVPCFQIKNYNFLIRGVSEFLMSYILWHKTKKFINNFKPSSILVYSPSIFFGFFCNQIKKKFNVKSLCILRDLFPYWAIEIGLIRNFFIKKLLIYILKNFLEIFDSIGLESKTNIKLMNKRLNNKYFFLPNWVNIKNFKFNKFKNKKKYDFIFAGNFGGGQDIEKVLNFIKSFPIKKINKLYLIGDGMNSNKIKKKNLYNFKNKIIVRKKFTQKKYINFLKNIDFGIVSLNDQIKSVNFPGRLFSYLMANRPVILLTNKKNELSNFIDDNKLGISTINLKSIEKDFYKIDNFYKKLIIGNSHIFNTLKKYNSLSKIANQVENRL